MRDALRRLTRPRTFGVRGGTGPVSEHWGWDRGTPIDRLYIEQFLETNRDAIRGRALEVKDDAYVRRFGGGLDRVDVLDVDGENPQATVFADLASATAIADGSYDCFVLTQTLQYVHRVTDAVAHSARILAPGGTLLATMPALSRVVVDRPTLVDYWRFTEASCRLVFGDAFGGDEVEVTSYGNAVAGAAFLLGYAAEELSDRELTTHDPRFPVIVAVRATRS